jgi:hypothetical protein
MKSKKWFLPAMFMLVGFAGYVIGANIYPYYHGRWMGTGTKQNVEQFSINTPSAGASAIFSPGVDNTNALGTSALRFSAIYAYDATLSDDFVVTDDTVLGSTNTEVTTVNGLFRVGKSASPDASVTPSEAGQIIWNTGITPYQLCFSTGSTAGSWVQVSTPSAACSN